MSQRKSKTKGSTNIGVESLTNGEDANNDKIPSVGSLSRI